MSQKTKRDRHILELMLIVVTVALTCLVYKTEGGKIVTLNLFYLPIVLGGFFLALSHRYPGGVLRHDHVHGLRLQLEDFASSVPPLAVGLGVTIWGAILCLTALMVGTLSDERAAQAKELHEAYVGVVEVLAKYLQGGNPALNEFTNRVAHLSQRVATQLKLSSKGIDDIRVAALMQGFSNIEITTKVISKAVHNLEGKDKAHDFRFHGTDLVHSLGAVLRGAIPILLNQDPALSGPLDNHATNEGPVGARILRVVRAYDVLTWVAPASAFLPRRRFTSSARTERANTTQKCSMRWSVLPPGTKSY